MLNRRDFVNMGLLTAGSCCTGCLGAGAVAGGRTYEPAPVVVARKAAFRKPGEKVRMGFIGSGGRGGANLDEFYKLGEEIVALCDVDLNHLNGAAKHVEQSFPHVRRYQDWRRMLEEEKDLDAVVVSTPDHMHATCAIAAMERGCHVYVEKPLVRTWWEAERFRDVAKACGVVTQMGNNGNGMDGQRRSVEVLQSGVLGDIREIHVTTDRPIWPQGLNRPDGSDTIPDNLDWNLWLGIAPKRPYKQGAYHSFVWRGWHDFGTGALGDIGCHAMSFFWRGLDLRETLSVEMVKSTKTFSETYPAGSIVKLVVRSARQASPVTIYWYDGVTKPENGTAPDRETSLRVTDGKSETFSGTAIIGSKGRWWNGMVKMAGDEKFIRHQDNPATRDIPKTIPRIITPDGTSQHHREFVDAIRGGNRPFSDYDHAVPLTEMVVLGCVAQRVPGRLDWDQKNGRFANSDAANALLKPHIRNTWTIG